VVTTVFRESLETYVGQILHTDLLLRPIADKGKLPGYLTEAYDFREGQLANRNFTFMIRESEPLTPGEMSKHVDQVQKRRDSPTILVLKSLSSISRCRLIGLAVSFVVPGNQLYIPSLAVDLREHFRAPKVRSDEQLTPAGQALLFFHLLGSDHGCRISSEFASRLSYTPMSMSRAFDELAECGLATTEKVGRERKIQFLEPSRALFDKARGLLRHPVKKLRYVNQKLDEERFLLSGEWALAQYTSLSRPRLKSYAIHGSNWSDFAAENYLKEVRPEDAEAIVENWSYDPTPIHNGPMVDPLSLFAQFQNNSDERLAMASEELLEVAQW